LLNPKGLGGVVIGIALARALVLGVSPIALLYSQLAVAALSAERSAKNVLDTLPTEISHEFTDSWESCIARAEIERGNRDTKFFAKAQTLINAKSFLVTHSLNNERKFCNQIRFCEQSFDRSHTETDLTYPICLKSLEP
jgi:hypothetical protein